MSNQNAHRILHVIHRMRPGGIQTGVMNLYRHIDRNKIQFDFAVRSHQHEYYDKEIIGLGGRLFHLPWNSKSPASLYAYKKQLRNILTREGPFLAVHSHVGLFSGHVLPIANEANIPIRLAHSHSASSDKNSLLRMIWAIMMRRSILNNATNMLTCSTQAADWLYGPQWKENSRIIRFPNAIDTAPFSKTSNDRIELRKAMGYPTEGPIIGHIGRFDAVKNHTFLLKFFSAFKKIYPDARLLLVGEGELQKQVEKQAIIYGIRDAVTFLGIRTDIPQILGALDLFVLPSLHEGFGIVVIEAQAAGTPCLVSNGVSPEVDLGLDLVCFESLSSGIDFWTQQAIKLLNNHPIPWEMRKKIIINAGYDIQHSVNLLQNIYLNNELEGK